MKTQITTDTPLRVVALGDLASLWTKVCGEYPQLSEIEWKQSGTDAEAMQFMPGPPPSLSFPLDAPESLFQSLLRTRPHSCALVARSLGIPLASLQPLLLRAFIFLHECGHAYDFLVHFASFPHGNTSELRFVDACMRANEREEYELRHLPIPVTPSGFLAARREYPEYLRELLTTHLGLVDPTDGDFDRVFTQLEVAYKSLPSEVFADTWAVDFFRKHPELLAPSPVPMQ